MKNEPQNAPPRIIVKGNIMPSRHSAGNVYDPNGISPTIMENHGYPAFILETMNSRLKEMLEDGKIPFADGLWIDTYNKGVNPDVAGTLRTTIDSANMHYVMEQIPFNTAENGLAYTITTRYGAMTASNLIDGNFPMTGILTIDEPTEDMKQQIEDGRFNFNEGLPRADNPKSCAVRGRGTSGNYSQRLEVGNDIANALTTVHKDSMVLESTEDCVKIPDKDAPMIMADPRKNYGRLLPSAESSPTLLSTDYKSPHLVIAASDVPAEVTEATEKLQVMATTSRSQEVGVTIKQDFSLRPHKLNKSKDGLSEFCVDYDESVGGTNISARPNNVYGKSTRFRIRKLTPRECYRLMDVPERCIDRMLSAGIAKSHHYKLTGNSIVVSCLYHIFKNLFTDAIPDNQQLSLF